jgi:undecaprenyl-diphosphatase
MWYCGDCVGPPARRLTRSRISLPLTESAARLTYGQAVGLGALHGPAELLPVSSSGHTTAVPWLFGLSYADLDPELRKLFEVALHTGTALGLLIEQPPGLWLDLRHLRVIAAASAPAGAAGLLLERRIESTLGTPASIAVGLLAGSLAMVLADRAPEDRDAGEAAFSDALWLGLAQATALLPGISRAGATLAAARARRFRREDADRLSGEMAWPMIGGAALLKAWRLGHRDSRVHAGPLLAGGASSFLSTVLVARLRHRRAIGSLLPYALYRTALAAAILLRLRLGRASQDQGHARSA